MTLLLETEKPVEPDGVSPIQDQEEARAKRNDCADLGRRCPAPLHGEDKPPRHSRGGV